ncbi:MAG: GntR family transcriptional regulator [Planctomycetota bacterium]
MRFQLTTGTPEPIYAQIARQVRIAIADGVLAGDERLPSVRRLARELVVNPNTVQKAYTDLERAGLVYTKRGTGTFVARDLPSDTSRGQARERLAALVEALLVEAVHCGLPVKDVVAEIRRRAGRHELRRAKAKTRGKVK